MSKQWRDDLPRVSGMSAEEILDELLEVYDLGDWIYDVRSRAVESEKWGPYEGNSWEHPAVKRYGELCGMAGVLAHKGKATT